MSVLTIQQATNILETLFRLQTEQNKKLVIYSTSIELESDSSTWRTVSSLAASTWSTVTYYAGNPSDPASRELSDLPPLMLKVRQAFQGKKFDAADVQRLDLAQGALQGLVSLAKTEYSGDTVKEGLVEAAQRSVREIITLFKQLTEQSSSSGQEKLIEDLRLQNATLKTTIDLLKETLQERKKEITRLNAFILVEPSDDLTKINQISTHDIIDRIHALSAVLLLRQAKTS